MPKQKKVAIIGNISSFDKCSITTALPIFAASGGIETYPLLTAIVASRDNDIDSPDYCDLTNNKMCIRDRCITVLPFLCYYLSVFPDFLSVLQKASSSCKGFVG